MQLTPHEGERLARAVAADAQSFTRKVEVVVCPSFTALDRVSAVCRDNKGIALGAQDVYPKAKGAFTGMVGCDELRAVGVSFVIIGHSERRQLLGESDTQIQEKVHAAIAAGFVPVLCVGETAEEKARGEREAVLARQLAVLAGVDPATCPRLVVAYEPVWAIGTGVVCAPAEAVAVHGWIKQAVVDRLGSVWSGDRLRVVYGGSVAAETVVGFAGESTIDGVLVGGASIHTESFFAILSAFATEQ